MTWTETEITAVVQETPMDRSFTLAIPRDAEGAFDFVPGQFLLVRDPDEQESRQRAYTISSAPGAPGLDLTVRDMGSFGHSFYDLPVGKHLLIRPPEGKFQLALGAEDDLVMLSGGSGVTPFRAFIRHLRTHRAGRTAWLVQCAQQADQLVFREEFERHAAECDWFHYLPTVTRAGANAPWAGRRGRIDAALLEGVVAEPEQALIYACGPGAFVRSMLEIAERIGVPSDRLRKEQWG